VLARLQGRIDAYAHALRRHALTVTRLEGVEACLDEANKLEKATMAQAEEGGLATAVWKSMAHALPPLPVDVTLPFGSAEERAAPTKSAGESAWAAWLQQANAEALALRRLTATVHAEGLALTLAPTLALALALIRTRTRTRARTRTRTQTRARTRTRTRTRTP
jgi:hypothetical protein